MGIIKRLSLEERELISNLVSQGKGVRAIARILKRSPSTISTELRRLHMKKGQYKATVAHNHAILMKRNAGRKKKITQFFIHLFQILIIEKHFSPEQVSGYLKKQYPDLKEFHISHETIYQFIYTSSLGVYFPLRRKKKVRRKRGSSLKKRSCKIPNRVSIHNRPPEIDSRKTIGHWEGDLIIGKNQQSAIGTLVERVTRFTIVVWLDGKRDSETVINAFTKRFEELPPHLRLSLTYDNGSEASKHEMLTQKLGMSVYFADPSSPWQRGSNENTNGLLREFLPKGSDLKCYTESDLAKIENLLNNRPRKVLNFETPFEVLTRYTS